jgi:hypothetical protein
VISIVKSTSLAFVAAACPEPCTASLSLKGLLGESRRVELPGLSVLGSGGTQMRASGVSGSVIRERSERPIQAPAAAAAQAHAYAVAAKGADAKAMWMGGGTPFMGIANAVATKQQTTRAFRGLKPWRDPA